MNVLLLSQIIKYECDLNGIEVANFSLISSVKNVAD
jgi:hypothetical protein